MNFALEQLKAPGTRFDKLIKLPGSSGWSIA